MIGEKKEKASPVCAKASPKVVLIPLFLEIKAKATTKPMVIQGIAISFKVTQKHSAASSALIFKIAIVKKAASKIAVPA